MAGAVTYDEISEFNVAPSRGIQGTLSRWIVNRVLPVATIFIFLIVVWYGAAAYFNWHFLNVQSQDVNPQAWHRLSLAQQIQRSLSTSTPTLPTPVQALGDFLGRVEQSPTSDTAIWSDLLWTVRAAVLGFLLGTLIGVILAVLFMSSRILTQSLMPYVVASQTIPIVALVPAIMITLGLGLRSEVLISAYLAFFSITISTYKGLQSVQPIAFDLMRSYAANPWHVFFKLRLPASLPFLFTGLKIGVTASLIGAIIAEMGSGSSRGLGQVLVAESTYSQNIQLWSTMIAAASLGLALYGAVVIAERLFVRWNVESES
ncbi:MAG TPA: ABC transporter permease [Chloroflexota bacterium]